MPRIAGATSTTSTASTVQIYGSLGIPRPAGIPSSLTTTSFPSRIQLSSRDSDHLRLGSISKRSSLTYQNGHDPSGHNMDAPALFGSRLSMDLWRSGSPFQNAPLSRFKLAPKLEKRLAGGNALQTPRAPTSLPWGCLHESCKEAESESEVCRTWAEVKERARRPTTIVPLAQYTVNGYVARHVLVGRGRRFWSCAFANPAWIEPQYVFGDLWG